MQPCSVNWKAISLKKYQSKKKHICELVQTKCYRSKPKWCSRMNLKKENRRLLNFGHTLGHALENQYELMHGQAVAIGMTYACHISEQLTGFKANRKSNKTY